MPEHEGWELWDDIGFVEVMDKSIWRTSFRPVTSTPCSYEDGGVVLKLGTGS